MKFKKFKINIKKLFICTIFTLQSLLIIYNTITIKKLNNSIDISNKNTELNMENINYGDIEIDIETIEEINALKQYKKPMIIVFAADYCPTCRNYIPYIKELYEKYKDQVIIRYIDTVKHKSIRNVYNIEIIPSTIIYDKNGEAYRPTEDVNVYETDIIVEDRKYKSDTINIVSGDSLGLNNNFEYGQNETGEIVYTKYVGLIDLVQLEEIIEDLLQ